MGDKAGHGDVAVLASEITNLACVWGADVARVVFATVSGVEVAHRCAAVAVGWDGKRVDVVDERAILRLGGEAGEVDGDVDSALARGGGDRDGASDGRAGAIVDYSET